MNIKYYTRAVMNGGPPFIKPKKTQGFENVRTALSSITPYAENYSQEC